MEQAPDGKSLSPSAPETEADRQPRSVLDRPTGDQPPIAKSHWGDSRLLTWGLWLPAGLLTWLAFVAANHALTKTYFSHLDDLSPPPLAEWQRLSRVADGASRKLLTTPGTLFPPAELLKGLIVVRGPHTRLMAGNWRDDGVVLDAAPRLKRDDLDEIQSLLEAELNPKQRGPLPEPKRASPSGSLGRFVAAQIDLLRLRYEYLTPSQQHAVRLAKIKAGESGLELELPPKLDEREREVIQEIWTAESCVVHTASRDDKPVEATMWTLDPLDLSDAEIDEAVGKSAETLTTVRRRLHDAGTTTLMPARVAFAEKKVIEAYFDTLNQLRPLDVNPQLALFPFPPDQPILPAHPPGFTIAYFPPKRIASKPVVPASHEPAANEQVEDGGFMYCLEVTPTGSWTRGESVQARFTLVPGYTGLMPIRSARQPVTEVLWRGPGWWGFRPVAVRVTEGQLSARFFSTLEEMRLGAGIADNLGPSQEEESARYMAFVRRFLESRLGSLGTAPTKPPQSFEAHVDPAWQPGKMADADTGPDSQFGHLPNSMEHWVEWPRRLNGGTGWGLIQFIVILMLIRFLLEFVVLSLITDLGSPGGRYLARRLAPTDVNDSLLVAVRAVQTGAANAEELVRQLINHLRNRTHTLSAIVIVLPVVGFFGTVAGLSNSLVGASGVSSELAAERQASLASMEIALGTAFDKSMLAFAAAIICIVIDRWMVWWINSLPHKLSTDSQETIPVRSVMWFSSRLSKTHAAIVWLWGSFRSRITRAASGIYLSWIAPSRS